MSQQIAQLTCVLEESETQRIAQNESMNKTVEEIKEQVLNLARRRSMFRSL